MSSSSPTKTSLPTKPVADDTVASQYPPLPRNLPRNRFELELEFIQSLASPRYLHHLANQNYLRDEKFLQFLRYLKYWKQPEYAIYITYPHCFFFLDLLCDNEVFRNELGKVEFQNFVHQQQFFNWQYRSGRLYGTGKAAAAAEADM